jgi:CheY-like chemotaxis protein
MPDVEESVRNHTLNQISAVSYRQRNTHNKEFEEVKLGKVVAKICECKPVLVCEDEPFNYETF